MYTYKHKYASINICIYIQATLADIFTDTRDILRAYNIVRSMLEGQKNMTMGRLYTAKKSGKMTEYTTEMGNVCDYLCIYMYGHIHLYI
jgi:hypothetical protein